MNIQENIPLSHYTTLQVGGPARFFAEAKNEEEILEALKFAEVKNLPVFVLGGGSNVLISDKGFDGLVVKIHNSKFIIHNSNAECSAGCGLGTIVNECAKAGLTGLEWAAGIPGTIGGAVRGNAGAFNGCMAEIINRVKVIEIKKKNTKSQEELGIRNYELGDCNFSYRDSIFKQNPNLVILSATLKLEKGSRGESEKKIKEILAMRKKTQPFDFPSSGSFFKNPHLRQGFGGQATVKNEKLIAEFERDTGAKVKNNVIPAGYIVEALGLKGKKIGGAMVSQSHGNFLVNAGGAKAEDFVILAALIKTRARNLFGVQLQEEVEMVGF